MVDNLFVKRPSFRPQASLEGIEAKVEEARAFLKQLYNCAPLVALPVCKPPTYFLQPPKPPPKPPPTSFFPFRELRPYQLPTRPMPAIFTSPPSLAEIAAMLCSLNNNKALGVDGVTTELLKSGGLNAL
jgi:hypothetical protein